MKREFYQQHSEALGQDMSMIVYGEKGYPVIAFQTQDSKSNNFEDFGMVDTLADYIDEGKIQLFSVDNIDEQSWSLSDGDKATRAHRQEEYFRFVTDELVPRVHSWNNSDLRPLAIGCSMGATHAALAALRRPDLFQGCIALSGVYRTSFFFGDWMNDDLYQNDIPAFLGNMSADHPYVNLYNHRSLVFCVGQGAWEDGLDDLHTIDGELDRLGVSHWCDFWGTDVNHDWPWWKKQIRYFLPIVLDDIQKELAGEASSEAEKDAKPEPAKKPAPAKVEPAKRPAPKAAPASKPVAAPKAAPAGKPVAAPKAAAASKTTAKAEAKGTATKKTAPRAVSKTAKSAATAKTAAASKPAARSTKSAAKTSAKPAVPTKPTAAAATKSSTKTTEAKAGTKPAAKSSTRTTARKSSATKTSVRSAAKKRSRK